MNDDLRDEDQDELGNGAALLDDSLFEEDPELDLLEDEEVKELIALDPLGDPLEEEEEEIYDELDALAQEEDEEDDFLMDSFDDDY